MDRQVYFIFYDNKTRFNTSEVYKISKNSTMTKEYTFDGHAKIEVKLLDASTKQVIDSVIVTKNNERDLDGLF